jgi:hypothetical protein
MCVAASCRGRQVLRLYGHFVARIQNWCDDDVGTRLNTSAIDGLLLHGKHTTSLQLLIDNLGPRCAEGEAAKADWRGSFDVGDDRALQAQLYLQGPIGGG